MSELFEQIKTIRESQKLAYEEGFRAGYEKYKKEMEKAQQKTIELEVGLENEAEELRQKEREMNFENMENENLTKEKKEDLI